MLPFAISPLARFYPELHQRIIAGRKPAPSKQLHAAIEADRLTALDRRQWLADAMARARAEIAWSRDDWHRVNRGSGGWMRQMISDITADSTLPDPTEDARLPSEQWAARFLGAADHATVQTRAVLQLLALIEQARRRGRDAALLIENLVIARDRRRRAWRSTIEIGRRYLAMEKPSK